MLTDGGNKVYVGRWNDQRLKKGLINTVRTLYYHHPPRLLINPILDHQPDSAIASNMPAIPHHNLPCTWLAPTALLVSFAAGIGFAAMKRHHHFCSPFLIAQPTVDFFVRVALVVMEDNVSGLVNIHD